MHTECKMNGCEKRGRAGLVPISILDENDNLHPFFTRATLVVMPHGAVGVIVNLSPANSCVIESYLKISVMCEHIKELNTWHANQ